MRSAKQWVAVGLVKIDGHPELFGKQAGEPLRRRRERGEEWAELLFSIPLEALT